ncbi:unnamed protein product [Rotaria sordida]|nr:unnamed protein product [Rotaria sordida]CAF3702955.1 unnamed protein product [Rotaria sordida]CAF3810477.1 unnamed protein product [Rotaria sordida]
MLLDGYFHLCQAILCTVRIVSRQIQFTYTPRYTYGLARVGVVGELVAFVSFLSLSVSVFLESLKHIIDVIFVIPKQESNSSKLHTAHGHEHVHSLIDHPNFILAVGIYATVSNCLLGIAILYKILKRSRKFNKQLKQRQVNLQQSLPNKSLSKSLLITDTLPVHHSYLQVFNMLLGPLAILACGILLIMLSEKYHVRVLYSRLVDPIICCILFLSYLFMIFEPIRDVMHLVLQAKPHDLNSDEIETTLMTSIPGVSRIHEFHVWRLTPQKTLATIHVVFNTTEDIFSKFQDICLLFKQHNIDHVTIQPEFSLLSDGNNTVAFNNQCTIDDTECDAIPCSENITTTTEKVKKISNTSSPRIHFHRRSSVGLTSVDTETGSEIVGQ